MKVVHFNKKEIIGLKIRTKNSNEANSDKAQIGKLWDLFLSRVAPLMTLKSQVFGVYFNYESDMSGEFDVLAGSNELNLESDNDFTTISIEDGNYLVFLSEGEMPKAVIDAWVLVWSYFSSKDCKHKRSYKTDFEIYESQNSVSVYIGIED